MKITCSFLLVVALVVNLGNGYARSQAAGLKHNFYKESCPKAEQIVQDIIWKKVAKNSELPAKLIRMLFHDCFVRGCDASLLLDSTTNNSAEKDAVPNQTIRGFNVIDKVKIAVEKTCPGIVSCSDIIALAARDAVSFQFKKLLWEVKTGRRDGRVSLASEALANIPSPFSNFSTLVKNFANKSLNVKDLVVLSGAHTIGIAHCNSFSRRLYNFSGKGDSDPSLDATYAAFLKTQCRGVSDNTTTVPMDPASSTSFDNHYYANLEQMKGLFVSDAALLTAKKSTRLVHDMLNSCYFFASFRKSIIKMGEIGVLTGNMGEIRKNCRAVN